VLAAPALPVRLQAEVPPIHSYSVADGLGANEVDQIYADSRGFIWFGTPQGLSRFDGYRFVNFGVTDGLASNHILAILETRAGEYLFGTSRGLAEFRVGSGGKFTNYLIGNSAAENVINALLQDSSGRIWCGTSAGLFEMLPGHTFRRSPAFSGNETPNGHVVTALLEDSAKRLWVGTRDGIDIIRPDEGSQRVTIDNWTQNVRVLYRDHTGRIWAGLQDGLVLMRAASDHGSVGVERIFRQNNAVRDITSLAEDSHGEMWAGTADAIARWKSGTSPDDVVILTRAQGMIDRQTNSLAADRFGNIWAGTESAGVMQIQVRGLTSFGEQDGLVSDRVWALSADRTGGLIAVSAGTSGNALNRFDGTRFHPAALGLSHQKVSWGHHAILEARDGSWWVATAAGLCRYAPKGSADRRPQVCYEPAVQVYCVFEDSKGYVWAAGKKAQDNLLLRWDPQSGIVATLEDGPAKTEGAVSFAEDRQGNVWIGLASGGGLFRYDGRKFLRFGQQEGIPNARILDLLFDVRGRLWMATGAGLGLVRNPAAERIKVEVYRASNGLASDAVGALTCDQAGRIYVATAVGLDRLDAETGAVKHFTSADGLARGSVTSALRDSTGNLWFGTTQGLSRLAPQTDRRAVAPSVRVMDLRIGNERYPLSPVGETAISAGQVKSSQNHLQISFVGSSDEPESHLRYAYSLGGEWQPPGRDHEVNFLDLPPAAYRFQVKAVNSDGEFSAVPAEIAFEILPPIWRRWWFESLAFAMVAGLAFVLYRRRLHEVTTRVTLLYNERLDERTRIARELHDTLLQNLAGVSLQLDGVAKQICGSAEQAAQQIQAVRQQVDDSFLEAREKVMALRSPMLRDRDLPAALRESLRKITEGHPIRLEVLVTGEPKVLRHDADETILRIGQEAVANVVRHAKAGNVRVSLDYGRRRVRLRVDDDGCGFDLDEASTRVGHWGLRNMRERAERIGADWHVTTSPQRGTVIETTVPFPENRSGG
jgi:signal transduction histidine kinase/ligand-binding sensor domain-containing protein